MTRSNTEEQGSLVESEAGSSSGFGTQSCSSSRCESYPGLGDMAKESSEHRAAPQAGGEKLENVSMDASADIIVEFNPPDGGLWAYIVVVTSSMCNGIIFGTINSSGVIYVHLLKMFEGDEDSSSKVSFIGSMAIGFTFLFSSISGVLSDKYGIRTISFIGGFCATLGMLLSSFFLDNIAILFFTYGVLFGGGSSLVYTPSLAILGHYFKRRLGLANGCVAAGSSLFTIAMPLILKGLLEEIELANVFRLQAGLLSLLMFCALTFRSLIPPNPLTNNQGWFSKLVNLENWKNKRYVIWTLGVPLSLFGYFVPYNHIVKYVTDILPDSNGSLLVSCIGITSLIGRFLFGFIADLPRVNCIILQQIAFLAIGLCTMLLTTAPYVPTNLAFPVLVVFALIFGLFDGCFISVIGPIAFEICGPVGGPQAIGFLLAMCSVPLTTGSPIAGLMYDKLGNYTAAFLVAGIPPIVGAIVLTLVHYVKSPTEQPSSGYKAVNTEEGPARADEVEEEPIEVLHNVTTSTTLVSNG